MAKEEQPKTGLYKIEFDRADNFIVVPYLEDGFFDRFAAAYSKILDAVEANKKEIAAIQAEYLNRTDKENGLDKITKIGRAKMDFSEKAIQIADGMFGLGTCKKYFASAYEEYPDFFPDAEFMLGFLKQITKEMEKICNRSIYKREKDRFRRLSKHF